MSYKIQGITNAIPKAAATTTGTTPRLVGQLVYLNAAGEVTLTKGTNPFPLSEIFDTAKGDLVAAVQQTGIAMVQVETATSIVAGSLVMPGTTGTGVALATATNAYIGKALKTPAGAGDFIPVLLGFGTLPA